MNHKYVFVNKKLWQQKLYEKLVKIIFQSCIQSKKSKNVQADLQYIIVGV